MPFCEVDLKVRKFKLMVQLLLTGEPALVASACSLLQKALHHNAEALPRLYQTGLYFFALAYCGSNLLEVATLFQVCRCSSFLRSPALTNDPREYQEILPTPCTLQVWSQQTRCFLNKQFQ